MALGRAIRAGAAYVELTVNDSKLVKGFQAAQARLMTFGASLRSLAAPMAGFGLAGAIGLGKTVEMAADAQEGIAKFSSVMGSETGKASAFVDDLAERVGRSAIDIRDSMSSFQAMFVGLNFDNAAALEMSKSLQSLAIDFAAFHNLSDEEAIERFLAAMGGSSEVFDRFGINTKASAMDQKFLQMGIKKTTANASEQQKVMARLNLIMEAMGKQGATGAAVRESGSLANRLKALKASVKDAAVSIGGALLPVVLPFVSKVAAAAKMVAAWVKQNPELAATLMKVVAAVAIGAVALFTLGAAATALGAIFGVLGGALTIAGTALGAVMGLVAALLSPIGLVTAAVVGLGAAWLSMSGTGGAVVDWLRQKFGVLMDDALMVFGAIRDALASGDFEAAAKILWGGLKLAWTAGVAFLRQKWAEFKTTFLNIATDAWFGAAIALNNALSGMEKGWVQTVDFFRDAWAGFTNWLLQNWNKISGIIRKAWAKVKATVTGDDATAEIKRIEQEVAAANEAAQAKTDDEISRRERERKARLSGIESEQQATNAELVGRADSINAGRKAEEDQAIAAAAADVAKARAELMASIEKVDQAKRPGGGDGGGPDGAQLPPDLSKAMAAISGGTAKAKELEANAGAVLGTDEGTKAVLAALRDPGADPQQKTADNTKKMAQDLAKLKQEAKETNAQLRGAPLAKVERA